jgi:Na+-driven multidrug efflux pump
MVLTTSILAVGALLMIPFREQIIRLFLDDDPVALALSVEYLLFILVGLPLMGVFQSFLGTFNGTGDTKYTFYMAVIRLWGLRIPFTLFFREFTTIGSSGVWWSILISNFLMVGFGLYFYRLISFEPKAKKIKVVPAALVIEKPA